MIRYGYYICTDHPNGPTMTMSVTVVRFWLNEGYRVVRVASTERVTSFSIDIDEDEERGRP